MVWCINSSELANGRLLVRMCAPDMLNSGAYVGNLGLNSACNLPLSLFRFPEGGVLGYNIW